VVRPSRKGVDKDYDAAQETVEAAEEELQVRKQQEPASGGRVSHVGCAYLHVGVTTRQRHVCYGGEGKSYK
jgi:hypothetical protein